MRNHWHFVVWPREEGEVTAFFRWLSHTHAMRWHVAHNTVGRGHLYQGRFKSFPVAEDDYFLTLCRYVEANALRAGLAERAEQWRWSGLWQRAEEAADVPLSAWPVERPRDWLARVNRALKEEQLDGIRTCVHAGVRWGRGNGSSGRWRVCGWNSLCAAPGGPARPKISDVPFSCPACRDYFAARSPGTLHCGLYLTRFGFICWLHLSRYPSTLHIGRGALLFWRNVNFCSFHKT